MITKNYGAKQLFWNSIQSNFKAISIAIASKILRICNDISIWYLFIHFWHRLIQTRCTLCLSFHTIYNEFLRNWDLSKFTLKILSIWILIRFTRVFFIYCKFVLLLLSIKYFKETSVQWQPRIASSKRCLLSDFF